MRGLLPTEVGVQEGGVGVGPDEEVVVASGP